MNYFPGNPFKIVKTIKIGRDVQEQTILTLPTPPGKNSNSTLEYPARDFAVRSIEKPNVHSEPNITHTAISVLHAMIIAPINQRLEERALQQITEVRELQKRILNQDDLPTDDFSGQLAAIRKLPHASDSEDSLMMARSANLYAQEVREGHIQSVQEALLFLPKLKESYEQMNESFQKIKLTQEKIARSKTSEELNTFEATLLEQNAKLRTLSELPVKRALWQIQKFLIRSAKNRFRSFLNIYPIHVIINM